MIPYLNSSKYFQISRYSTPIQSLNITSPTSPNKQTGNSSSNTSSKQFHVPHENSQKQRKANDDASGDLTESEEKMSDQEKLANCYVDASLQVKTFSYILSLILWYT